MVLIALGLAAVVCLITGLVLFFLNPDRERAPQFERDKRKKFRRVGIIIAVVAVPVFGLAMIKRFHLLYLIETSLRHRAAAETDLTSYPAEPASADAAGEKSAQVTKLEVAQATFDKAIAANPKDPKAYASRGNVYALEKKWDLAVQDYKTSLKIDGTNSDVKFNLAEVGFLQKKYDEARPGFLALKDDMSRGDLAAFKVFMCDLLGGHEKEAAQEFDVFNQVGGNPSYYFANMAWCLKHQDLDGAKKWEQEARYIYRPAKYNLYAASLVSLAPKSPESGTSPENK